MTRRNGILLAAVLVLAVLDFATREERATVQSSGSFLDGVSLDAVTGIRIRGPEGDGEAVVLARRGTTWTAPELLDFPVVNYAVLDLLRRLLVVSRADLVAREAATAEDIVSSEGRREIELFGEGGELLARVEQLPPAGDAAGTYVRRSGSSELFRAPALVAAPAQVLSWIDARLLDVDPARVRALETEGLRIERTPTGAWSREGEPVTRAVAQRLVDAVCGLAFSGIPPSGRSDEHGLASPTRGIVLELDDGNVVRVELGVEDELGNTYAARGDWRADWVVVVPEALVAEVEAALAGVHSARD